MVDTSAVGTTDDPFPMTVERGKIREFAKATMSENPDYLERESPPIEPTFLTSWPCAVTTSGAREAIAAKSPAGARKCAYVTSGRKRRPARTASHASFA